MRISSLSELKNSHFIGLAGQSNANGYQVPADTAVYEPRKGQFIFNNVTGLWEQLQENHNNGGAFYDYTGSVGCEMELMRLMHNYYGADQFLFKYAVGGTSLAPKDGGGETYDWVPGTADAQMYNGFVANFRQAHFSLPNQMLRMKVLIWIQGENDAGGARAAAYKNNLINLINAFKNALGLPQLLVLQTLLANTQTAYGDKSVINNAKIDFSTGGNKYVNIDGAEVGGDAVHFTVAGQAYIAGKLFTVLKTML